MIFDSKPYTWAAVEGQDSATAEAKGLTGERQRVLGLVQLVYDRLVLQKGRGWKAALERLLGEIENGHQQLPAD